MYFDMDDLDYKRSYKLLTSSVAPRPIAWVTTCNAQGRPNAAPYSLFNYFNGHPPVVCVGMGLRDGEPKDSLANIRANGEFVVNLVSAELAQAMNTTAVPFAPDVNELEKAGLQAIASSKVAPPRIARSPVSLECRVRDILPVDTTAVIVLAHVVGLHVRDDAVRDRERCHLDTARLDLVGRMESPGAYALTRERFVMKQLSVEGWEAAQGGPAARTAT